MVRFSAATLTWAVLSLPSGGQAAPPALKAAQIALETGQPKAAVEALGAEDTVLPDWRALLLGRALAADGQTEGAIRTLRAVGREPIVKLPCQPNCVAPAFPLAQEALAELLPPAEGAAILLELPPEGPRLRRAMTLAEDGKKPELAAEAERRLLVLVPESFEARKHASTLGPERIASRLETRARRLERTRQLLETHQSEAAHVEASLLIEGASAAESCELHYVMGKAARKMRRYPLAIEALGVARKRCREADSADLERRSLLLEAQVRGIRREPVSLAKVVLGLEQRFPKHSFVDDALFLLAEARDQTGKTEQAEESYLRIVTEFPEGDHAIEANWRLAYRAFKSGNYEAAAPLLEVGAVRAGGTRESARARYWRGRIAEARGESEAARVCDDYEAAAFEPPLTYYTWLALSRTEQKLPECAARIRERLLALRRDRPEVRALPGELRDHPQVRRARRLAEAGMKNEAILELSLLEHDGLSRPEVIALAAEYDAITGHREAQWLIRTRASDALSRPPIGADGWVWRAAYSRPFWSEIEKAAAAMKLDPLLLVALVREESTFDPRIVSWAGATGLAQLMPGTAMTAYADLNRGRLDLERLFEPELNVQLGAYVLRSGFRRFEQQAPLALAAYNGGAGLAAKTLPSEDDYPFDHWAEEIFVKETRNYVKRVMGTYGIYRFFYEEDAPLLTLPATVPSRTRG